MLVVINEKEAFTCVNTSWILILSDSDRIQTCNLLIRSQMLYSVELRSHISELRVQRYGTFLNLQNFWVFFLRFISIFLCFPSSESFFSLFFPRNVAKMWWFPRLLKFTKAKQKSTLLKHQDPNNPQWPIYDKPKRLNPVFMRRGLSLFRFIQFLS